MMGVIDESTDLRGLKRELRRDEAAYRQRMKPSDDRRQCGVKAIDLPAFVAAIMVYVLAGLGDGVAGGSQGAPVDSCRRSLIPPPLKDLGKDYKLRVVYFVPADADVKAHYREKAEVLMRVVADVFRRELKANDVRTRGIDFEFERDGRLKVHLVRGRRAAAHYSGEPFDVDRLLNMQQQEIWEATGFSRNRPILCFSEAGAVAEARPIPHIYSGFACVSGEILHDALTATTIEAQIESFTDTTPVAPGGGEKRPRNAMTQTGNGVLIHELGHLFGMLHDTRDPRNIMMRGYDNLGRMYNTETAGDRPVRFSRAHARMAAATRFFSESFDADDTVPPVIETFEPVAAPGESERSVGCRIRIRDDRGIGPFVVLQRGGGQIDVMVADGDAAGATEFSQVLTLTAPRPFVAGQPLVHIINVLDVNGNLSQSTTTSTVLGRGTGKMTAP